MHTHEVHQQYSKQSEVVHLCSHVKGSDHQQCVMPEECTVDTYPHPGPFLAEYVLESGIMIINHFGGIPPTLVNKRTFLHSKI